MKYWIVLCCFSLFAYAMNEAEVQEEVVTHRNVEELSTLMQRAPAEYRHYYLEAIKAIVAEENAEKRARMLESFGQHRGFGNGNSGGSGGGKGGGGGGNGGGGKGK